MHAVRRHSKSVGVTLFIDWGVKPFSMALLAWLFIRELPAPWLPAGAYGIRDIFRIVRKRLPIRSIKQQVGAFPAE